MRIVTSTINSWTQNVVIANGPYTIVWTDAGVVDPTQTIDVCGSPIYDIQMADGSPVDTSMFNYDLAINTFKAETTDFSLDNQTFDFKFLAKFSEHDDWNGEAAFSITFIDACKTATITAPTNLVD